MFNFLNGIIAKSAAVVAGVFLLFSGGAPAQVPQIQQRSTTTPNSTAIAAHPAAPAPNPTAADNSLSTQLAPAQTPTPQCSITVSPSTITAGESAVLQWSSSNASTASVSGVGNNVKLNNEAAVSPSQTTTYAGTFTNANGKIATCTTKLNVTSQQQSQAAVNAPSSEVSSASTSSTAGSGIDPSQFVQTLYGMENAAIQNDPLVAEKNILLKLLNVNYQISPSELASLSPDIQQLIQQYPKQPSIILLQIQAINQEIAAYNLKMSQQFQTQINNYSAENGLPITQPVPTQNMTPVYVPTYTSPAYQPYTPPTTMIHCTSSTYPGIVSGGTTDTNCDSY